MKVSCQACGAKYTIADDKVRGRKVKIRCKSCGTPMVVDGQSDAPEAAAPASASGGPASSKGAATSWSVNLSDTDQRTMTTDEIVAAWKTGELTSDAFVWKDGMADWIAILDSEELKPLLSNAPAATGSAAATPFGSSVAPAPAASARLAGGRGAGVDLFELSNNRATEEEEIATSAPALPTAGSTAYDDGKLTGARNENSVLFSLDALKSGMPTESKKGGAPARKAPAAPMGSDPFAMSPADTGSGNALFSLNANQALLTAPAPPEPPPPRVSASGAVVAQPMNKLLVYGGGGAAAVILLLLGLLLGRSGNQPVPSADASAKENAAATTSAEPEKKAEAKPEEKPAESAQAATSAAAAPSAAPAATGTTTATASPSTKVAATTTTTHTPATSSGSTASKEKEKTPAKPAEETMPSVGSSPFSVSAAQVALTQAATNAGSCAKPAGPTGSGKVQVTFATSGRVTTATVMGPPFAGTPVGGCVAGVFRKARIPAFAGNPVTVSKSFAIH